jgi:hypothetical protein
VQTPVTINPDAKDVIAPINERLDKLTAQVARDKGVEVAALRAVLVKLGKKGVPEEDIPKRLNSAADELIKLRADDSWILCSPGTMGRDPRAPAHAIRADLCSATETAW